MDKRITDIEIQLMHQENMIQQLNEVISGQQQAIERLQADVRLIVNHLRSITPSPVRDAADEEPPPHY